MSQMKIGGYLYIISNPAHVGWLKIGVTEDIKSRLHVYQTGDPQRSYKVEYYVYHPDCYQAEKKIKEMMKYFAKRQRKEWFECDLGIAKARLDEQLEDLP
jgi:predicted GIY-YIG superfamily endonuclease